MSTEQRTRIACSTDAARHEESGVPSDQPTNQPHAATTPRDEIDALIDRHIQVSKGMSPAHAWLRDSGIAVWVLIGDLQGSGNPSEVAEDYDLPIEAVLAAIHYYRDHSDVIDARITLGRAAFVAQT